jgi:hypothetical protein
MLYNRCTQKLIQELRRNGHTMASEPEQIPAIYEWYANLLLVDRRKCCFFTQPTTLFSFFVPGLKKADFTEYGTTFRENLRQALHREGFDDGLADFIVPANQAIGILKTTDRSVRGSMNDLIRMTRGYVEIAGGLAHCDIQGVNHNLNRAPMKALGYGHPIDAFRRLIDRTVGQPPLFSPMNWSAICRSPAFASSHNH